jgi:putative membrane protein
VPGVSGGTVAFVTGIYEELLTSIKSINPLALRVLAKQGFATFWSHINGTFLLVLMLGVITSFVSLARVITYLLVEEPLLVWSFFFGLIFASSIHIIRQIKVWKLGPVLALGVGALAAYTIGELKPADLPAEPLLVFLSGCIAICAMILPGISGSFILVLLGMYSHVLEAISELNWLLLATFAAGCGCGLLVFSHILSWLFNRFHDLTMALLTGFLLGSLNLVWPWKQTLSTYQNSKGVTKPLEQENILPATYHTITGVDPQLVLCVSLVIAGLMVVLLLEKIGAD